VVGLEWYLCCRLKRLRYIKFCYYIYVVHLLVWLLTLKYYNYSNHRNNVFGSLAMLISLLCFIVCYFHCGAIDTCGVLQPEGFVNWIGSDTT